MVKMENNVHYLGHQTTSFGPATLSGSNSHMEPSNYLKSLYRKVLKHQALKYIKSLDKTALSHQALGYFITLDMLTF